MEQKASGEISTATLASGENERKNTGFIVGMSICAALAVAGVAFGIYGMTGPNSVSEISDFKVQVENQDGTTTTFETDEIKVSNDTNTITITDTATIGADLPISEAEAIVSNYVALGNYRNVYGQIKASTGALTEHMMVSFATRKAVNDNGVEAIWAEDGLPLYYKKISYDMLNTAYQQLFGKSLNIEKKDYELNNYDLRQVTYDSASDVFTVIFATGLGGSSPTSVFTKLAATEKTLNGFNAIIVSTSVNMDTWESYTKTQEQYDQAVEFHSYRYEFVDDGGYVLRNIAEIR